MPWWTDPDSLTPPVSRARLLFVLARLFDQNLKQIALNKWAASAWHHPVRLSVHDDGDLLLHVESLYGPAFVTDAAALRAHIQATNFAHCLSSIRLVPTSAGHRILASSWTPLMLGAEDEQLRDILRIVVGSTVGPLNDLAEQRGLPASEPVDDPTAAAAVWDAFEAERAQPDDRTGKES
ncbi:hypothetical protein [Actinomyces massiliensis]|jgi:hypothetical protein|uniref:Bacterial sensory transduction regulator n=1 Tax=Actinomyces massiliensis F0489 TaxID=1125718 RepID=J0MWD8_9ACTO|nr:hypothetical protein [Actinomyces massiliensis]EJF36402.1 hypothetical protein HMPREF1318_2226 [Actinomyces massiliensis F0489]WLD71823.1 hypothetical protein QU670_00760 [Actinomyces massiliensis]